MKTIRAIDVCAGAGGWAVAARGLPIKIIAAFDREQDCLDTYALNHPGTRVVRCDVVEHDFSKLRGKVELVLGGIPCEQISNYRAIHKPKPAELAAFGRILERCLDLPKYLGAPSWCYEDVTQIEKHLPLLTKGFTLDSAHFSAQRRPRHFVGNLPMPKSGQSTAVLRDALRSGPYRIGNRLVGRRPSRNNAHRPETFYPWEPDRKSPTVVTLSSRRDSEAATPCGGGYWRQLEWQELATLQGFPPDYVFVGSPSRVIKMIAQAVQIDTARAILVAFVRSLEAAL